MRRGEIWWANLPRPAGPRPVVLVSRDEAYELRKFVMVAPVTTRVRGIRAEVHLDQRHGLRRPSVVNADSIETIPRGQLERQIGMLDWEERAELDRALRFALGLEE